MKTIRVVAAVIKAVNENGEATVFATQRGYGDYKGGWEFPGGKIEEGETPQDALKREIMEELDTEISVGELIDTVEYDYPTFHLSMDCFWCEIVSGDLVLKEHEAAKWLDKESLYSVDWLPADVALIERIQTLMKEYKFYGWQGADVPAVNEEYKGIENPRHLYDLLSDIWCAETCAPRMRDGWTKENMTLGQCSITAFLAQDIFGGEVYGILRSGGNYHCYNVIGECVFDLTSEQFGDEVLSYEGNPLQSKEVHFAKEEKRLRYEYLKEELKKTLCEN